MVSRKDISGRQDSKHKGSEMGLSLVCLRNNKEAGVSRAEDMRWKKQRGQSGKDGGRWTWSWGLLLKDSGFHPKIIQSLEDAELSHGPV